MWSLKDGHVPALRITALGLATDNSVDRIIYIEADAAKWYRKMQIYPTICYLNSPIILVTYSNRKLKGTQK